MTRHIVLPPVAAFAVVTAYLVVELFAFRGLAATEPSTVSEAAAMGHAARALQLIAEGQNPNAPQHVRSGVLDAGEYEVRPLEAAILGRHGEMVRLLLRTGAARFDTARAACFARARLPEVLPDLGAASAALSGTPTAIADAMTMCAPAKRVPD